MPFGTIDGRTAIGIEAAAETFFNKHARELDLDEAALLAGLPQAPSQYNPFRNPTAALRRRNEVLEKMAENDFISRGRGRRGRLRGRSGSKRGTRYTSRREPFFFDYVQEKLIEEYGVGVYRRGGLKVHTTIEPQLQDAARAAILGHLSLPTDPSSAVVSIDPATGYIRAMASSGTYKDRRFNLAAQGHRQPGSAFKTMVLMTAIRKGIDPSRTTLHVQAAQPERARLRAVEGQDLRQHLRRVDEPGARHAGLGQHRLRAARSSTSGPRRCARRPR